MLTPSRSPSPLFSRMVKKLRWPIAIGVSGALLPLAFAPYGLWPLALVSTALLAIFLATQAAQGSAKTAIRYAFFYGLGLFGHGASWVYVSIHDFGFTGVPLAILMTLAFVAFLAFVFSLPFALLAYLKLGKSGSFCIVFSALWVLGEWLRSWLFTGFPWLYVGYAHVDSLLAGWAPVGGVFALSFLSLLSSTLLVQLAKFSKTGVVFTKKKNQLDSLSSSVKATPLLALSSIALLLSIWFMPLLFNSIEWTQTEHKEQRVSIVQPNVELMRKWDPHFYPGIIKELDDAANQNWHADIQVWPEAAIPSLYNAVQYYVDDADQRAIASQTNVISGVLYDHHEPFEVYNSIVGFGLASGVYFKQKLVPFGEYVPLEKYLRGVIAFFDLPNSVIRRGPYRLNALSAQTRDGDKYIVAPFICYEVVYPDFVAANAQDASLLVTISNDAWFGNSIGPHQHFEMVRMRALEAQKYFVRATNTGISAIVDHRGQVLVQGEQFTREVIQGSVMLRNGLTPFAKYGSWPILLAVLAILSAASLRTFTGKANI